MLRASEVEMAGNSQSPTPPQSEMCDWCIRTLEPKKLPCSGASDDELRRQYHGGSDSVCKKQIKDRRPDLV